MDKKISPPDLDRIDYLLMYVLSAILLILYSDMWDWIHLGYDLKIAMVILSIPLLLVYIPRTHKKLVKWTKLNAGKSRMLWLVAKPSRFILFFVVSFLFLILFIMLLGIIL